MHKKELSGRPAAKTGSREGAQPTAEEEDEGGSAAVPPPLVLPWRPLFNLMVSLFGSPAPRLEGGLQAGRPDGGRSRGKWRITTSNIWVAKPGVLRVPKQYT
jgi:hypothetical protein